MARRRWTISSAAGCTGCGPGGPPRSPCSTRGATVNPLRILHLEDSPLDAELVQASLDDGGLPGVIRRVETRDEFAAALAAGPYDVILADYSLPAFDGISALTIARAVCPETPFLFVSGALGEEAAIETLKRGATDYVLKGR